MADHYMLWFGEGDIATAFVRQRPGKLYFMHKNTRMPCAYTKMAGQKDYIYAKKLPEKAADMLKTHAGKLQNQIII